MNSWNFYSVKSYYPKTPSYLRVFTKLCNMNRSGLQVIPLLICAVLISSCSSHKDTRRKERIEPSSAELKPQISEEGPTELKPNSDQSLNCLEMSNFPKEMDGFTPATILSVEYLNQRCLAISFQYSGCNEGAPRLCRGLTGSQDGAQSLSLLIEGAGPCEMLLESKEYFDISVLGLMKGEQSLRFETDGSSHTIQVN